MEPERLADHGQRLWRSIVGEFDLDEHELILLEQCARSADLVATLAAAVEDAGGPVDAETGKVRPVVVELRQQRIVLARLLAALRVPLADHDDDAAETDPTPRLQRRTGARGVYSISGGEAS
jgi:hypothetical protein